MAKDGGSKEKKVSWRIKRKHLIIAEMSGVRQPLVPFCVWGAISPSTHEKSQTLESHSISRLPFETLPRCYSLSVGKEHAQLCLISSLFWWYVGELVFSSGACALSSLGLSASASFTPFQILYCKLQIPEVLRICCLLNFCHPCWTILNRQASYRMIVSSGIYCLWVRSLSWSKT